MRRWLSEIRTKWHSPHNPTRPTRLWEQLEERALFDATGEMDLAALVGLDDTFTPEQSASGFSNGSTPASDDTQQSTAVPSRELVIVDSSVENHQQFVDDIVRQNNPNRDIEVVLLDAKDSGVQAIGNLLANYADIDALHIVSHGTDAGVQLGSAWLTQANLSEYSEDIANWRSAFSADGDLLFYGCDLGGSAAGQQLVDSLSSLIGADVAASTDDTGFAPRGGDWDLEYTTGEVAAEVAFSVALQSEFAGLLAPGPNVTLSVPSQVPLGEDVNFSVTFQNTGPSGDVGYGPFIRLC